jgi:predicted O-methyltransferase YrrM
MAMNRLGRKVLRNIPGAMCNPRRAWRLLSRRLVPLGVVWRDPDAYQVVGSWTFGRASRVALIDAFPDIQSVDVNILRGFDRSVDTSPSPHEILALSAITRFSGAKRILEIGTSDGNTTLNLAANSPPDAVITTVDLPSDWSGHLALRVPPAMVNFTGGPRAGAQFRNTRYASKINQVYGDSAAIDWSDLGGPFDLIFIDGNHYYDYVKSDTKKALGCLLAGGLIVWHDYGMIEDVSRAVDEIKSEVRVLAIRGTSLAVGRPE